jgi:hypothetical protein
MVGLLTQDRFKSKIVVILAGYDQDINKLLSVNSGLYSESMLRDPRQTAPAK